MYDIFVDNRIDSKIEHKNEIPRTRTNKKIKYPIVFAYEKNLKWGNVRPITTPIKFLEEL
jgi:hypothetical protein